MQKKVKFCNYYDENFKKAVILDVTENHLNYHEVVRKYWNVLTEKDIDRYRTTVRRWVKGYQRNGGINFMPAFNERKLLDENGDRSKPLEEYTREELIAENRRLLLENLFLKKLDALIREEEEQKAKWQKSLKD